MIADPLPISKIFKPQRQYLIPIFQRPYVWTREDQWEKLWEDMTAQARARLFKKPAKPHYCGAVVVDQRKSVDQLPRYHVIDGQQRLTTFQIVLCALRDVCVVADEHGSLAKLLPLLVNSNFEELENPEIDQRKLRPTRFDRQAFDDVFTLASRERVAQKYLGLNSTRGGKAAASACPNLVAAYLYFHDQADRLRSRPDDVAGTDGFTFSEVMEALVDGFIADFVTVMILLDTSDDAQVIFESLNSRHTPLLASDLVRNHVFLRAEQNKEAVDALYDTLWSPFETPFWRTEQTKGRIKKPRLEFFMANVLEASTASEVPLGRIYQEYLAWIAAKRHELTVKQELELFGRFAAVYRELADPAGDAPLGRFARFLKIFDMTTVYPLVLYVFTEPRLSEDDRITILADLESFLLRRAVCRLSTANYNRLFLKAIHDMRSGTPSAALFRAALLAADGHSTGWPSDAELTAAWMAQPVYDYLAKGGRLAYVLERLEYHARSKLSEDITINSKLSVEHVMPQGWHGTWPLADGSLITEDKAKLAFVQAQLGQYLDPQLKLAAERERLKNTFGNLTLITQALNSSVGANAYVHKRAALLEHAGLRLNRYFQKQEAWDVVDIQRRGEELLEAAIEVWPRPTTAAAAAMAAELVDG